MFTMLLDGGFALNNKAGRYIKTGLAALLPACICSGLSLLFTDTKNLWYVDISKPVFHPTDDILAIGWLVALAGIVAALMLAFTHGGVKGRALYITLLCLALIALWHYIFFYMGNAVSGFYALCLIVPCSIYMAVCMFRRHKAAGLCSLPMVFWLCFLCADNYMIFMMN